MNEPERTGERFHFFPEGTSTPENNQMADMLVDIGFREVTAGGPNYGPVHGSGRIFEHYINFRRVIVEEADFCTGIEAKWWEFPKDPKRYWCFGLYSAHFPDGFDLLGKPPPAPHWDQGRKPHFWLYKQTADDLVGVRRSRILYSSLDHLHLYWEQHLESFDQDFVERLAVAMDGFMEDREMIPFLAKTNYSPASRDSTWRRPIGWLTDRKST